MRSVSGTPCGFGSPARTQILTVTKKRQTKKTERKPMARAGSRVIQINIGIVFIMTTILNLVAYNAEDAKIIGYLYFSLIGLTILLGLLILLTIFNYSLGHKDTGKSYLRSILFSILTFLSVTIFFWFFKTSI